MGVSSLDTAHLMSDGDGESFTGRPQAEEIGLRAVVRSKLIRLLLTL